jgi:hypothetical protein
MMWGHAGGSWRRRVGMLLVAAVIAVGGPAVVAPSSASAAPRCEGHSCDGKDPERTGCNTRDHRTITLFSFTDDVEQHTYQLRKSFACLAVWGRFIVDHCTIPEHFHHWLRVDTQIWSLNDWRPYKTHVDDMWNEANPCGGIGWTPMAPAQANTRARVGWGIGVGNDPPTRWDFSGWYNGGRP